MENLSNEIWKDIEGFYSGRYKISSNGNLKRTLKTEASEAEKESHKQLLKELKALE